MMPKVGDIDPENQKLPDMGQGNGNSEGEFKAAEDGSWAVTDENAMPNVGNDPNDEVPKMGEEI